MQGIESITFNPIVLLIMAVICIVGLVIAANIFLMTKPTKRFAQMRTKLPKYGAMQYIARWVDRPAIAKPRIFILANIVVVVMIALFGYSFYLSSGIRPWFGTAADNFIFLTVVAGFIGAVVVLTGIFLTARFKGGTK